jgi:hypothetical protein
VPVRVGKNKAEVEVKMGEYTVKGTFTKDKRTVEVLSKEGVPVPKTQEFLNKIIGKLAFDPMKFYLLSPKEQTESLRELVGFNVDDIEAKYREVQGERAQINSNKTLLAKQVDEIEYETGTPDEEVSIGGTTAKLRLAMKFNSDLREKKRLRSANERAIEQAKQKRKDLLEKIKDINDEIAGVATEIGELLSTHLEGVDAEPANEEIIQQELATLETTNKNVRAKQQKAELQNAVDLKTNEYTELGRTLKALDKTKAERIAAVQMPVEGLSLTSENVMFGELPLKQVNTGEQIKIAVAISMAMNPTLKTVFIKANDLDEDNLKLLEAFIVEKGYQGVIELADTRGEVGIVIEDGMIKGKD